MRSCMCCSCQFTHRKTFFKGDSTNLLPPPSRSSARRCVTRVHCRCHRQSILHHHHRRRQDRRFYDVIQFNPVRHNNRHSLLRRQCHRRRWFGKVWSSSNRRPSSLFRSLPDQSRFNNVFSSIRLFAILRLLPLLNHNHLCRLNNNYRHRLLLSRELRLDRRR
jgi:hypothetical protein